MNTKVEVLCNTSSKICLITDTSRINLLKMPSRIYRAITVSNQSKTQIIQLKRRHLEDNLYRNRELICRERRQRNGARTMSKKEMASLILGTIFSSLWLLRSRPDQVNDEYMRGDPPRRSLPNFNL